MKNTLIAMCLVLSAVVLMACSGGSGDGFDISGTWLWRIVLTENPCGFGGADVGDEITARAVISRSGNDITLRFEGVNKPHSGTTADGTFSITTVGDGNYTNVIEGAAVDDDTMSGDIWDIAPNGCRARRTFTATRISHQILF